LLGKSLTKPLIFSWFERTISLTRT